MAKTHIVAKAKECPNCNGTGTTDIGKNTVICCVCLGSGKCPEDCFKCKYHLYDSSNGTLGCVIIDGVPQKRG